MSLWPSPWPAEDGGPRRAQAPRGGAGLALKDGERLVTAARRDAFATTMVVLREPGEVFALRHTIGARPMRDPCVAWVERLDPQSLEPLARSADLAAGPFWPGGIAAHGDGSLHVVFGRHCHRLSPELELRASRELPRARAYNSFVVLADGSLAMKDIDRSLSEPSLLTLLDPATLERRCDDLELPEPVVARLAADGDTIHAVGATAVHRIGWDGARLALESSVPYLELDGQSHGWDPVIEGGQLWLLDQGVHEYATTMRGAGVAAGPVHLIRISLADPADRERVEVCGLARGTVTDPPLYDPERRVAIGYDSGNGVLAAFRFGERLEPLWRRELSHSAHMIRYPETGEIVVHDHRGPAFSRTRAARAIGRRAGGLARSRRMRGLMARRTADEVCVLDIETGAERGRAAVPTMFQSVLFPAPGWARDLYWCTFSTLARIEVAPA